MPRALEGPVHGVDHVLKVGWRNLIALKESGNDLDGERYHIRAVALCFDI
jgi:hypothetical protein